MNTKKPRWIPRLAILSALCFAVSGCGLGSTSESAADSPAYGDSVDEWFDSKAGKTVSVPDGFESIEWEALISPNASGEEAYTRYEDQLAAVGYDSPEADVLYEKMQAEADEEGKIINTQLDGQQIFLAGFASPFSYDEEVVTEFLLVPYFGACVHVPAPPENQTIMVTLDKADGLDIEDTWGAIWVAGNLKATPIDTDLATAGYTLVGEQSGVYEDY